jgi:hypothetical protein
MAANTTPASPLSITEGLVAALADTWRAIRSHHPAVPDAVLTVASAGRGRDTALGHLVRGTWARDEAGEVGAGELAVSEEALRAGETRLLAELAHQAAHGLAVVREVGDTSRQGRYHNARFKALAEELGLHVEEDGSRGWASTSTPPAVADQYADVLEQLAVALTAYPSPVSPPGRPKSWQRVTARCHCSGGRPFLIAPSTLAQAPIVCGACASPFTAADAE